MRPDWGGVHVHLPRLDTGRAENVSDPEYCFVYMILFGVLISQRYTCKTHIHTSTNSKCIPRSQAHLLASQPSQTTYLIARGLSPARRLMIHDFICILWIIQQNDRVRLLRKPQTFIVAPHACIQPSSKLQVRTRQPGDHEEEEDGPLGEPWPSKLGVEPFRLGEVDGGQAGEPVGASGEGGHAQRVAVDGRRRPQQLRPPCQEQGGHAQHRAEPDGLRVVESVGDGV